MILIGQDFLYLFFLPIIHTTRLSITMHLPPRQLLKMKKEAPVADPQWQSTY